MKLSPLVIALAAFALAGCGVKLFELGPAPDLYDISPEPKFEQQFERVSWQLVIDEPGSSTSLNTDRILVRPNANEIRYFAAARWSERAPRLIQSRLVEAFDKSGAIVGVGRQSIGLRGDYNLQGELIAFDTLTAGSAAPVVRIALTIKLVRQPSAIIVAARSFDVEERASDGSLRAIAASYEAALGRILSDIVPWTLREAEQDYAARSVKIRPGTPAPRTAKEE